MNHWKIEDKATSGFQDYKYRDKKNHQQIVILQAIIQYSLRETSEQRVYEKFMSRRTK